MDKYLKWKRLTVAATERADPMPFARPIRRTVSVDLRHDEQLADGNHRWCITSIPSTRRFSVNCDETRVAAMHNLASGLCCRAMLSGRGWIDSNGMDSSRVTQSWKARAAT